MKAQELVDRFGYPNTDISNLRMQKQCALICVEEITEWLNNFSADTETVTLQMTEAYFKDLEQLKQDIEKL